MTEEKQRRKTAVSNLANNEIDSRLAQAIRERAKAMQMVSKLVHWQDRLMRVEQEINSLIGYQQRLAGKEVVSDWGINPSQVPGVFSSPSTFSHLNEIPPGVGSIPAKEPKITPSHGNVADKLGGEEGFQ